jgi:hypothetical protein
MAIPTSFIPEYPGTRYGRLIIIRRAENIARDKSIQAAWLCQCDCGNQTIVRGRQLRSGKTKSCGCLRDERAREMNSLPKGICGRNRAISVMRANAKKRGHKWELTDEQVITLMVKDCYYCGAKPSSVSKGTNGNFIYNGLDRVDNNGGYTTDNIVPCCISCNESKRTKSVGEFLDLVERIYIHSILKRKKEI